jgi:hypothetical protein
VIKNNNAGALTGAPGRDSAGRPYPADMCRSIKTLRAPYQAEVDDDDVRAAALQYVRKISGFRAPSARNSAAFTEAVDAVAAATQTLLDRLVVPPRT